MMTMNAPKRPLSYPLSTKSGMREPTALNGKKLSPKVRNRPTYSNTLNNYEAIRNLVTVGEAPIQETIAKAGGKKHVSISI